MSKHLQNDLERLEKRLLILGSRVEDGVRRAITALLERDTRLAEELIAADAEIDREEVEIEEDCLKILALHQPVATDLRFTAACLKINNDLERIGDLSVNIAKRARSLGSVAPFAAPNALRPMVEETATMLRESLDAFVRADPMLARKVLAMDTHIDQLNRGIIEDMLEEMRREDGAVEQALSFLSVSKHLERIADHATNIAEDVVYMVEGEIIRHDPYEKARAKGS